MAASAWSKLKSWAHRHPALAITLSLCLAATTAWAVDTAISALAAGDPATRANEIPVNQAGTTRKITVGSVVDLAVHPASSFALTVISDAPSANTNDYNPTNWDGTEPSKATVIRMSPTISILLTGLTGGTTGRVVTLVNATDPAASTSVMILIPHESTASTAANRFTFADRMPAWLLGGESMTLVYDATSSRWRPLNNWTPLGASRFTVYDDFSANGASSSSFFIVSTAGTGSTCQAGSYLVTSATQKPIGTVQCDGGTTATGRSGLMMTASTSTGIVPGQGQALFLARIATETLSNGANTYELYCGFEDGLAGTSPTDGIYWLYQQSVSTIWRICTEDSTTQQCTTLGAGTVDTNYIWLMIYVSGDWQNADFFHSFGGATWVSDDSPAAQNPPEAADTLNVQCHGNKTVGTTSINYLDIDIMAFRYDQIRGT